MALCSGRMAHLPDHKALNKALDTNFSGVGSARHITTPPYLSNGRRRKSAINIYSTIFYKSLQVNVANVRQKHDITLSLFAKFIIEQMF